MEANFLKFIENDRTFRKTTIRKTSKKKQLIAFKHQGFWQCVDTKRDLDKVKKLVGKNKKKKYKKF